MRKNGLKVPKISVLAVSSLALSCGCHTKLPINPNPGSENFFVNLSVGQEWKYRHWQKPYSGDISFTGDTVAVSVMAKQGNLVTFRERSIFADVNVPEDTVMFQFEVSDSLMVQLGENASRIFGFAQNHGGQLTLVIPDSNQVTVDLDSSLFLIRDQVGSPKFVGHSESLTLFSDTYDNVAVFYDQTPTYVDGFGHLACLSRQTGLVATIYFGGFSLIESYGYQLVK